MSEYIIAIDICSKSEFLERELMAERHELVPLTLEEFILEFDPVQAESVEEALHHVHRHKNTDCERHPHEVSKPHTKECSAH